MIRVLIIICSLLSFSVLKLVNITIELSPRVAEAGNKEAQPIYCKKEPEYTTGVIITL